jgi:hypothetical protein
MKLTVYEYLKELNESINNLLKDESLKDYKNTKALRRYLQVSKLLFVAEKILEKDLIDHAKGREKK